MYTQDVDYNIWIIVYGGTSTPDQLEILNTTQKSLLL